MKIINIVGREIYDSRGLPTVECEIYLEDGSILNACVPSGTSCGKYEALELRDGGKRLMGMGVTKAVNNINNIIAPQFLGKEPNAIQMDLDMIQMDGSINKSNLGANAILAVSMAIYRAHAYISEIELYDFIALTSGSDTVSLPIPMINFINGGLHSDSNLLIQEYLVVPYGAAGIKSAIESSVVLFNSLKDILKSQGKTTSVGLEGGFASVFNKDTEPFDVIIEALEKSGLDKDMFSMGVDVAASQYYDIETNLYNLKNVKKTSDEMIAWYGELIKNYNLYSIEDGLADDDWAGWIKLTDAFGKGTNIVADDIFVTNPERIARGIEYKAANSVIIKPNQIGTVTESLQAIQLCKEAGLSTVVSNRSGETNDTFIVDIAVGASSNYIKCGGLTRGERIAKYNRLLEIESTLTSFISSE